MKTFLFILLAFTSLSVCAQQGNLHDLLKMANTKADEVKKKYPNPKPAGNELPPEYDNSWHALVTVSTTVTRSTDLVDNSGQACPTKKRGSSTFTLQGSLSTDKFIMMFHEDNVTAIGNPDTTLARFETPLTGSYTANLTSTETESGCTSSQTTTGQAQVTVDPEKIELGFGYDRKRKEGNFVLGIPDDYNRQASGKVVTTQKGQGSHTFDGTPLAKAGMDMSMALFGSPRGFNYAVMKQDPVMQDALDKNLIGGGRATINETASGFYISYSFGRTIDLPIDGWTGTDRLTLTTTVSISLTTNEPSIYEAILAPIAAGDASGDYQQWIPEGPRLKDPNQKTDPREGEQKGNALAFRVYIASKKDSTKKPIPGLQYEVDYQLTSSHVPGICMNYPEVKKANGEADLKFDEELEKASSALASYAENHIGSKANMGDKLIAFVRSYDYGSYGSLKAHVILHDPKLGLDISLMAHLKNDKADSTAIPCDENKNRIADAWEKQMGIFDLKLDPASDLDNKPAKLNQQFRGDGYSAYEEYRGFSENYQHLRTDPATIDVMICNNLKDIGAQPYKEHAENGISLYHGVTGIVTHSKFKKEEFGRQADPDPDEALFKEYKSQPLGFDKVLNFNYEPSLHSVDQHGILLSFGDTTMGICAAVPNHQATASIGTPKNYAFLVITKGFDPSYSRPPAGKGGKENTGFYSSRGDILPDGSIQYNPNGKARIISDFYASTVAHEMLHCSNVAHHGDGDMQGHYELAADGQSILFVGHLVYNSAPVRKIVHAFINDQMVATNDPRIIGYFSSGDAVTLNIGVPHGESSGEDNCIMRYAVANAVEENGGNHFFLPDNAFPDKLINYASTTMITGTGLCNSQAGTGVNGAKYQNFGDASRGKCIQQVKVNDKN